MRLSRILEYNDIIIQCHDFPDPDTIASGYCLYRYLKSNNKNPKLIYSGRKEITKSNILVMIKLLDIAIEYVSPEEISKLHPELLVNVDCVHGESNVTHISADKYMAIDHHLSVRELSEDLDIRPQYSSCCSILKVLLEDEGIDYNSDVKIATAIYYGLYTDTNGMTELNSPVDRDIRDQTAYDRSMISLLVNSNISVEDMAITSDALNKITYDKKMRFAISSASACDPNILGLINDIILQVDTVDESMVWCRVPNGIKISVRSCVKENSASELAGYICSGIGSGGGHRNKAGGFISGQCVDLADDEAVAFFERKISEYLDSYEIIYADRYETDITEYDEYEKCTYEMGFIPGTEIFPEGSVITVRSIEGDMEFTISDDVYIMVDEGNAYPIRKQKFLASYSPSETIFNIDCEYIPKAYSKNDGSYKLLDTARRCTARPITIMAKKLTRKTKLFTSWDNINYMSGNEGDYLICSPENKNDLYIIEKSVFERKYRKKAQ